MFKIFTQTLKIYKTYALKIVDLHLMSLINPLQYLTHSIRLVCVQLCLIHIHSDFPAHKTSMPYAIRTIYYSLQEFSVSSNTPAKIRLSPCGYALANMQMELTVGDNRTAYVYSYVKKTLTLGGRMAVNHACDASAVLMHRSRVHGKASCVEWSCGFPSSLFICWVLCFGETMPARLRLRFSQMHVTGLTAWRWWQRQRRRR